jgi:hypothetical protein
MSYTNNTNANDSTASQPSDAARDDTAAAVLEAVHDYTAENTVWTRDELADLNGEQVMFLFRNALTRTDETDADEQDADGSGGVDTHDDGDADADGDGDPQTAANVATNGAGGGASSTSVGAGTMAAYCEREGIEGGTGDARRARSGRYCVPLVPDEMRANADREPSGDASAGTMADYLDRDVDMPTPRFLRGNDDAEEEEAAAAEQEQTGGEDFGWPGGDDDADAEEPATAGTMRDYLDVNDRDYGDHSPSASE